MIWKIHQQVQVPTSGPTSRDSRNRPTLESRVWTVDGPVVGTYLKSAIIRMIQLFAPSNMSLGCYVIAVWESKGEGIQWSNLGNLFIGHSLNGDRHQIRK